MEIHIEQYGGYQGSSVYWGEKRPNVMDRVLCTSERSQVSLIFRILDWCPSQSWNTSRAQVQGHGNLYSIWMFLFDTWSAQTELFNGQLSLSVRALRTAVWVKELMTRVTRTNEIS